MALKCHMVLGAQNGKEGESRPVSGGWDACLPRGGGADANAEASGDDVGDGLILEDFDLVLQSEFSFLEAGQLDVVAGTFGAERLNGAVEITMLGAQNRESRFRILSG
jgi:hypothetical protein